MRSGGFGPHGRFRQIRRRGLRCSGADLKSRKGVDLIGKSARSNLRVLRFPRIWCLAGLSKSFPHANNPPCFYDRLRRLEQGGHADQELTNKDIDDDRTAEYALEIMDLGVQVVVCQIPLFPLDNIKVLRFYDFALILPMVSSCYQQYSVSPSEGKLIPNSALFIYHFVSFTPGF